MIDNQFTRRASLNSKPDEMVLATAPHKKILATENPASVLGSNPKRVEAVVVFFTGKSNCTKEAGRKRKYQIIKLITITKIIYFDTSKEKSGE